jgi:hypothetical protein
LNCACSTKKKATCLQKVIHRLFICRQHYSQQRTKENVDYANEGQLSLLVLCPYIVGEMAIMAMTTSNSINVKASFPGRMDVFVFIETLPENSQQCNRFWPMCQNCGAPLNLHDAKNGRSRSSDRLANWWFNTHSAWSL